MKYLAFALVTALLASCALESAHRDTRIAVAADKDNGILCTTTTAVGSSIREKRCTTADQRAEDRRAAEDIMTRPALGGRRGGAGGM